MANTKLKTKGFSFTIDSLLNSSHSKKEIRDELQESTSILLTRPLHPPEVSRSFIPPLFHVTLSNHGDWRADGQFSECSDVTDRESPISSVEVLHVGLDVKAVGTPQDSTPLSSTSHSISTFRCPSTPSSEASLDSTYTRTSPNRHKKKARTAFTQEQLDRFEKEFQFKRYLSASDRGDLAEQLKLTNQQVKTWFQNRRMKEKRQQKDVENESLYLPTGGIGATELGAHGIPYPLPLRHMDIPPHSAYGVSPVPRPSPQFMSPMSSPYLGRDSTALYSPQPVSLTGLPYYSPYQSGQYRKPSPHFNQMYLA